MVVSQSLMLGGREFQTEGAATENVRPAMLVRVFGMISSGALADRNCLAGAAVWSMSLRYDGYDIVRTLCVRLSGTPSCK